MVLREGLGCCPRCTATFEMPMDTNTSILHTANAWNEATNSWQKKLQPVTHPQQQHPMLEPECTFMLLVMVNLELKYFPKNSVFLMLASKDLSTPAYLAIFSFLLSYSFF